MTTAARAPIDVLVLGATSDDPPPGLPERRSGARYRFADTAADLRRHLPEAEVVFHWENRTAALREHWQLARRLRWIHAAGVGVEWSLFPELVDSEVVLTNCRGVFDVTMSEYALLLMLALAKDLPGTLDAQRRHEWRHRPVERLAGRHLVVLGAGSIGRAIGRLARAAGLTVEGVARRHRHDDPDLGSISGRDGLHAALARADFVVVALPLTSETAGLLDRSALAALKPTARLINVGRGAIIDEDALLEALRAGRLAGAALDVFAREPLSPDHPFWTMPNVIVSPHMSGDTHGWLGWFVESFLTNLARWRAGEPLAHVVDKRLGYIPGDD